VSQTLITRTLSTARRHGAAVPAMPVALTIKQAHGPLPAKVQRTIPRHELWAMQTPQIMGRADLLAAFETCPIPLDQITGRRQLLSNSPAAPSGSSKAKNAISKSPPRRSATRRDVPGHSLRLASHARQSAHKEN